LLAASLAMGAVYWLRDLTSADTAKILITVGVWAAYSAALGLRLGGRLLAQRLPGSAWRFSSGPVLARRRRCQPASHSARPHGVR